MTDAPYAQSSIAAFAAAVGEHSPAPASGSALAVAGALAAALAELTARATQDEAGVVEAVELRTRLLALADEDAAAYAAFTADRNDETRKRIVDVPLDLVEAAERVAALAERLERQANRTLAGDAAAAIDVARAVARAAARLTEINRSSS